MSDRLAELDLAAAIRMLLRHPLVRAEVAAIVREAAPAQGAGPSLVGTAEVQRRTGAKDRDTVLGWISRGLLPATRPAGTKEWRVREEDLEAFIAGQSTGAKPLSLAAKRAERAAELAEAVTRGPKRGGGG